MILYKRSKAFQDELDKILNIYGIPPLLLGAPFKPNTYEEAARERMAYYQMLGIDTPIEDDDAITILMAEKFWNLGMPEQAREIIEPLTKKINDNF